jgi:hypothetical protein
LQITPHINNVTVVFEISDDFIKAINSAWPIYVGINIDGALKTDSRDAARVKAVSPESKFIHCRIHRSLAPENAS